jgi:integrase
MKAYRLDSRDSRKRLKVRPSGKPYFARISKGNFLGYRKLAPCGRWVARVVGQPDMTIADADDIAEANGKTILSHRQAVDAVTERMKTATAPEVLTVRQVFAAARDTSKLGEPIERIAVDVAGYKGPLGDMDANHPRITDALEQVRAFLVANRQVRAKAGKVRTVPVRGADEQRKRRNSVNRYVAAIKSAARQSRRKLSNLDAWVSLEKFKGAAAARVVWIEKEADAAALVKACDLDFGRLVQAALHTGCRYQELARLRVEDFDPDLGRLTVWKSKTGKRTVVLGDAGVAFFAKLTRGSNDRTALIFTHRDEDGTTWAWGTMHQRRRIIDACERAGIRPINFHALRHTWASHLIKRGVPLLVIAKNLGHSDTKMVETHYGHLAASFVDEVIRKAALDLGTAA